jgi:hypothetical protein
MDTENELERKSRVLKRQSHEELLYKNLYDWEARSANLPTFFPLPFFLHFFLFFSSFPPSHVAGLRRV